VHIVTELQERTADACGVCQSNSNEMSYNMTPFELYSLSRLQAVTCPLSFLIPTAAIV